MRLELLVIFLGMFLLIAVAAVLLAVLLPEGSSTTVTA